MGVSEILIKWIKGYLKNRHNRHRCAMQIRGGTAGGGDYVSSFFFLNI